MAIKNPLEVRANQFVAEKLREARGDETRVSFGKKVGCTEAQLFQYENFKNRPSVGKLVLIARGLGRPLTDFIIPDEDLNEPEQPNDVRELKQA